MPAGDQQSAVGGMVVERVVLRPKLAAPKERSFLTEWLPSERLKEIDVELPLEDGIELPPVLIENFMGCTWELLLAEVKDSEGKAGPHGQKRTCCWSLGLDPRSVLWLCDERLASRLTLR